MSLLSSPRFLNHVLWLDAASCLACGALQLLGGGALAALLGLPAWLLAGTGAFLVGYAVLAGFAATRRPAPRALVALFVAGNAAWGVGCVLLLLLAPGPLSALGQAYVAMQAVTVFVLAELQWAGLRRAPALA